MDRDGGGAGRAAVGVVEDLGGDRVWVGVERDVVQHDDVAVQRGTAVGDSLVDDGVQREPVVVDGRGEVVAFNIGVTSTEQLLAQLPGPRG